MRRTSRPTALAPTPAAPTPAAPKPAAPTAVARVAVARKAAGPRAAAGAAAAAVVAVAGIAAGCGSSGHPKGFGALGTGTTTTMAAATTDVPPTPAPTTPPTTATPPTTVDVGVLPQTHALPSATDAGFTARMGGLCEAIASGDPGPAQGAFFPLGAYIQVKGISDPVHDYQTRLIPDYDQDIQYLHGFVAAAGGAGTLAYVHVPDAAEWILPGVEYNKGSYYRVYGTVLGCTIGGQVHTFSVASLISWRGEWYVVHLHSIR